MRKILFSIIIIITALFLFLLTYDYRSEQEQLFSAYMLSDEEFELIQEGDIILRHGYGLVSDIIVKTLKEDYNISHCAIVVRDEKNKLKVIHTVSQSISDQDGMQQQHLKTFIKNSKSNSIIVVRLKNNSENTGKLISQKAQELLNLKIPFDHSFDITDDSKLYCSELIWKIILDEFGIEIFPDRSNNSKSYLNFSNFYNPEFFEIIINHHK